MQRSNGSGSTAEGQGSRTTCWPGHHHPWVLAASRAAEPCFGPSMDGSWDPKDPNPFTSRSAASCAPRSYWNHSLILARGWEGVRVWESAGQSMAGRAGRHQKFPTRNPAKPPQYPIQGTHSPTPRGCCPHLQRLDTPHRP